ncbi:putative serine protease 47 [Equus asinus]|uniref:putative serine protease 47 n=1 Tax=Equus asinus TaxID=9793 RepID=UPI0038F648A2
MRRGPASSHSFSSMSPHSWASDSSKSRAPEDYQVLLGSTQLYQQTQHTRKVSVSRIIVHPDFEKFHPFGSDIAMLQLLLPVNFTSSIAPVCLPAPGMQPPSRSSCWITGWGMLSEDTPLRWPFHLQEGKVGLIENKFCNILYGQRLDKGEAPPVHDEMLCAGDFSTGTAICRLGPGLPAPRLPQRLHQRRPLRQLDRRHPETHPAPGPITDPSADPASAPALAGGRPPGAPRSAPATARLAPAAVRTWGPEAGPAVTCPTPLPLLSAAGPRLLSRTFHASPLPAPPLSASLLLGFPLHQLPPPTPAWKNKIKQIKDSSCSCLGVPLPLLLLSIHPFPEINRLAPWRRKHNLVGRLSREEGRSGGH